MKIKSLILAFPVLCLACNNPSTPTDPASQMEASPIVAKRVAGVKMLTTDLNYDQPCNILGEEYVRKIFNLEETTKLEEMYGHDGCEFAWEGNKVIVAFGGNKPYTSVFTAEYMFDKLYQGKHATPANIDLSETHENPIQTVSSTGGTNPHAIVDNEMVSDSNEEKPMADASTNHSTDDAQPQHGGVSAAAPALTTPSIGLATGEAVRNLGDKAVWDAAKGAMHVLYNNHIINVTVETKGKSEARKEQALSLVEVLIEKIAHNEYQIAL